MNATVGNTTLTKSTLKNQKRDICLPMSYHLGRSEVMSMAWNKEDFSQYNNADSPSYSIQPNGKVDIGNKQGDGDTKIGLSSEGMLKLVYEWIQTNRELTGKEKEQLINLLK